MSKINNKSLLIAGAAAGAVMNAIDIAANWLIVDNGLRQRLDAINPALWAQMNAPGRLVQYILLDFVFAFALVWLYAAIRPRFGPGPSTAIRAAIYGWALYTVTQFLFVMMGLFTVRYVVITAAVLLVNYVASALVGAKLYRESDEPGNQTA
jgi:hypothetical protein